MDLGQLEPHKDEQGVVIDLAVHGCPVGLVASAPLGQGGITLVLRFHELPWHVSESDDAYVGDDNVRDREAVIVDDGLQVTDLLDGLTLSLVVRKQARSPTSHRRMSPGSANARGEDTNPWLTCCSIGRVLHLVSPCTTPGGDGKAGGTSATPTRLARRAGGLRPEWTGQATRPEVTVP